MKPQNVVTIRGPDSSRTTPTTLRGWRTARIAPTDANTTQSMLSTVNAASHGPATVAIGVVQPNAVSSAAPTMVIAQIKPTAMTRRVTGVRWLTTSQTPAARSIRWPAGQQRQRFARSPG
jgi:hypothetical protein